jgi:membrane protease YdiL (CAAX protease family)
MNNLDSTSISGPQTAENPRALLAAPKHTMILFGIVMMLTVAGVLNSSNSLTASQAMTPAQMIKTDLVMIGVLWMWVFFVYRGMQDYGHSILEFLGLKSFTPIELVRDCVYAALAFALIYLCSMGLHSLVPENAAQSNNPLLTSTPEGLFGIAVWICLSISAGICEEIVFRGYLQRQLALMTGNAGIAIVLQALLFGIGHAYEGVGAVLAIVAHGLFLGILAHWRRNIRAGMIEHAGWDILAGFGLIGANW